MNLVRLFTPLFMVGLFGMAGLLQPSLSPGDRLSTQRMPLSAREPLPLRPPGQSTVLPSGELLSRLPLYFIENRGQVGAAARYYIQGRDRTLYFTAGGVIFRLMGDPTIGSPTHVLTLQFAGADPSVQPGGVDRVEMTVNYFVGPPGQWRTGLPAYTSIVYRDLWPGIDLIWRGESGRLKQLFRVQPGADPGQISLIYRGALDVDLESGGSLAVTIPAGSFRDERPYAWQEGEGDAASDEVPAAYRLTAVGDGAWSYGFEVGAYDPARPLLLDPELFLCAGYVGGAGDDEAAAVAVDAAGSIYIVGSTTSIESSFPDGDGFGALPGPDRTFNDNSYNTDAFVVKVRPNGQGLVYAGYIGGADSDFGHGIAVDQAGNAYITGETMSDETTFPAGNGFGALPGPDHTYNGGYGDAFVVKVKPDGTGLVYAGYIGGSLGDAGLAIAVDAQGSAYVAGMTGSDQASFPTGTGFGTLPGPDRTPNGDWDAFVVKVSADGTRLVYGGYIGGSARDQGNGIAVDGAGRAYIMGQTDSTHTTFPDGDGIGTLTSFDATYNGGPNDAFVVRVRTDGTGLEYAGFIGGNDSEHGGQIALDAQGNAYVAGTTWSGPATFPDGDGFGALPGPDRTFNGNSDAFVAKVRSDGRALVYAGYIGGRWYDYGFGIAVDQAGNAYVTGETGSQEDTFPDGDGFGPLPGPDRAFNGGDDAYVVQVKSDGAGFGWATYSGGDEDDTSAAIAVSGAGIVYAVGTTESGAATFPDGDGIGPLPSPDRTFNGGRDAFLVAIGAALAPRPVYLPLVLGTNPIGRSCQRPT